MLQIHKKILTNIGIASSVGLGVFGTVASIGSLNKHSNSDDQFSTVNNALKDVNTLYGGVYKSIDLTKDNLQTTNTVLAKNFEQLMKTITTSANSILNDFQSHLNDAIDNIINTFNTSQNLTTSEIANIANGISSLISRLESVESHQATMDMLISDMQNNFQDSLNNLTNSLNSLSLKVANLDDLASVTTGQINNLKFNVNMINTELIELDKMVAKVSALENELQNTIDYLNLVSLQVNQNNYDIAALTSRIESLEATKLTFQQELDKLLSDQTYIINSFDSLSTSISILETNLNIFGNLTETNRVDIENIKTQIENIIAIEIDLINNKDLIISQVEIINQRLDNMFLENTNLRSDLNYLSSQNSALFSRVLALEQAVTNLQSSTGSFMLIQNPERIIYENINGKGSQNFANISVTNIENAKNLSIYAKMESTNNSFNPYIFKILDTYPQMGINLIGGSLGTGQYSYMLNANVTSNALLINSFHYRISGKSWLPILQIDNIRVTITKINLIY